jgi:hypothetical protein
MAVPWPPLDIADNGGETGQHGMGPWADAAGGSAEVGVTS